MEFVDVVPGKEFGFIRFCDEDATRKFLDSPLLDSKKILEGEEEKTYWTKIRNDKKAKTKKNSSKKVRGREKLLKKAEQELGKHIRFEN